MVALLAACLGCLAVAPFQPGQHALADMNAAVVNDIGLHHLVAVGLHHISQCPTQQVVTHMTQVEGLVGVGTRVFNHHQRALLRNRGETESGILLNALQQLYPLGRINGQVQETLDYVELADYLGHLSHQLFTYLLCCGFRSLPAHLQEGEHHQCQLPFELCTGLLQLHHLLWHLHAVQFLCYGLNGCHYFVCYFHTVHYNV